MGLTSQASGSGAEWMALDGSNGSGRLGAGRRWTAGAALALTVSVTGAPFARSEELQGPAPRAEAGAYLAARAAGRAADFAAAGPLFARALANDPANPSLLENALGADLGVGRFGAARATALAMQAAGLRSPIGQMVLAAGHGIDGDWRALLADLDAGHGAGPLVDGLGRGWAHLALDDREAALAAFDEVAAMRGLRAVGLYHKALALGVLGDVAGAEAILATEGIGESRRGVAAHALVLGALGRGPEAVTVLDAAYDGDLDAGLATLRARLAAGDAPPLPVRDARQGLAEVYNTVAAALDPADAATALMYTRVALALDPAHADAALLAADRLETLGRDALALDAYGLVDAADPNFVLAEMGRAAILGRTGEGEAAVEVLSAVARDNPGLADAQARLGDELRRLDRLEGAEAAYDRAIALHGEGDGALWFVHYARARTREAAGDWAGTEADLRRALELRPGQAQVLNHLGYGLVERGEKLDEALAMIEEAVALDANNGAIVDSLGWAQYRLGLAAEAVVTLERAAALEAADAVVNDHLGDAYWAVGRTREARFQWNRALSFAPEPDEEARIRDKLARGLDAVLAAERGGEAATRDSAAPEEAGAGGG